MGERERERKIEFNSDVAEIDDTTTTATSASVFLYTIN